MSIRVFKDLAGLDKLRRRGPGRRHHQHRGPGAERHRPRLRAPAVRPHGRDAGRPEDPDHPRLLRALLQLFPVRGQCAGALRGARRYPRGRPPDAGPRGRAGRGHGGRGLRTWPQPWPELARETAAETFDKLIAEALGHRASRAGRHAGAAKRSRACARLLGQRSGSRAMPASPRSSRPSCEDGIAASEWGAIAHRLGANGTDKRSTGNRLAIAARATARRAANSTSTCS